MSVRNSRYFVPALSLMLFAASFKFDQAGVSWFWAGQPLVAIVLATASAIFWMLLFASPRKRSAR
ncbi:MAG: hypothetical protein L0H23_00820 [Luteimonas sp.]|nr:hypothetical protein [Luteimonas sp.]